MKIFITGSTGFIGCQLINRLAITEHEMFCLIRRNNQVSERLKSLGANLILGDTTDKRSVLEGMRGCDWVIHLAGLYSFWEPDNRLFEKVNVEGTRNVMECALETKVLKVVHISSVVIFGKPSDDPFKEESQIGFVRFSRYAKTKYQGDQVVWDLFQNHGLPVVVIYPTSVCGAGDPKASGKYVSDLTYRRLPAAVLENASLTFIHVKDVAEAIVKAIEKPDNIGEKYLLGKNPCTFREINKMIAEISGVPSPKIHFPDFLTMTGAYILTGISRLTRKPPPWGMSVDQIKTMKEGFKVDGSKAERELGIFYTPFRIALQEKIAELIK
jgi:dihydroflavonol-4-reductase